MASFNDLENEIKSIANAFTSINYYNYGERSSINYADRTKNYPALLFDSKNVTFEVTRLSRNHLAIETDYSCVLYIMDDFNKSEQSTKTVSEKESEVKIISDQFWAEFMSRTVSTQRGLMLISSRCQNGVIKYDQHNNRVIEIQYNFVVRVTDTSCTLGTFNY